MSTATATIHAWEEKGLGIAPFRVLDVISLPGPALAEANPMGYQNASAEACQRSREHGVHCGTCDVCGTGIMHNFVILSADGKRFVVGSDCVAKTGDAGLIGKVDRIVKDRARAKRDAEREEKRERDRPAREARQAERDRLEREHAERAAANASANRWILEVLEAIPQGNGGFVDSMIESLNRSPVADLSDRCVNILATIYAKAKGGRAGSKAYRAAEAEFWEKVG